MPETTRQPWRWLELWTPCGMLVAARTPRLQPPQPHGCSRHNPTVAAATTQHIRSLAPTRGRRTTEGMATPVPKVTLLPAPISFLFKILAMACANSTISTATKHTSAFSRVHGWKTEALTNPYRFGGGNTAHATATAMLCSYDEE